MKIQTRATIMGTIGLHRSIQMHNNRFSWEHWEDIYFAISFIRTMTKDTVHIGERNGTILYEHAENWDDLVRVVICATHKWPHLADTLLSDLASNPELLGEELYRKYWGEYHDGE